MITSSTNAQACEMKVFEGFRASSARKVKAIKEIKEQWNDWQAKLETAGLSTKESMQLAKENRQRKVLNILNKDGGPFTGAEEIDEYMESKIADQIKQQRMKNDVTYTRDSTRSISAAVTLFRIMKTDPITKKRITFTACEFAENLKIVLGMQNSRTEVTMDNFLLAL